MGIVGGDGKAFSADLRKSSGVRAQRSGERRGEVPVRPLGFRSVSPLHPKDAVRHGLLTVASTVAHPHAVQHEGEFSHATDPAIANDVLDSQGAMLEDLINVCLQWYRTFRRRCRPSRSGERT